jgi:hypothetical protein
VVFDQICTFRLVFSCRQLRQLVDISLLAMTTGNLKFFKSHSHCLWKFLRVLEFRSKQSVI